MGEVGVRVTGEQHALEEHQAGGPDRRRAAEPRQDLLGDDRLNQEQQEGGEEDRRRVRQARQQREADYLSMDFRVLPIDRKSTRLNSSHGYISYAVFCLKKKKKQILV